MDNQLSQVTQQYLDEFYQILDRMIQRMTNVNLNNSISHNFILQMIPHHEAAIDMSHNILKYTTNIELQNIAMNIISTQNQSIQAMLRAFDRCSTVMNQNTDVINYQRAFTAITETMFNDMANAPISNNININFINEMIPHHVGAINMSRNALRFDLCTELIPILNDIIRSQSAGVQQMRALLQTLENHT